MNRGKWEEREDFPGLKELSSFLTPEKIMEMDEFFYRQYVQPKFFYLTSDELWKWKVNVLCFMDNQYQEKYKPFILSACEDPHKMVSEMAQSIYAKRWEL